MSARLVLAIAIGAGALLACRGEPAREPDIQVMVDSLRPAVERAVGLHFRTAPRAEMRSREQVHAYLEAKLDTELPESKARGIEAAYRLFGLLPDTVHLRPLLLDLLSEQVVGYYDADSAMLFGVAGSPPEQLRLVLAHEMVHALQGQYLPLDSIFHDLRSNDRLSAAQAILEGQATFASLGIYAPNRDIAHNDEFWSLYHDQVREQQTAMPVFGRAPMIVREQLIFPYVTGADFMHWWSTQSGHADTVPYGPRMPASTEQVLHPDRYVRADAPLTVVMDTMPGVIYQDVLGEMETNVFVAARAGSTRPDELPALGWGGDLYRVVETPDGPALVWYLVFDDRMSAERFQRGAGARLTGSAAPPYRAVEDTMTIGAHPAIRYVVAPSGWLGWSALPLAHLAQEVTGPASRGP